MTTVGRFISLFKKMGLTWYQIGGDQGFGGALQSIPETWSVDGLGSVDDTWAYLVSFVYVGGVIKRAELPCHSLKP